MAYDTQEERLKVRGSEQITRDLKVNRDVFIGGSLSVDGSEALTTADKAVANGVATLDATGRVPYSQLPESAMEYKGTWDASTNTPSLADGTGTNGDFYVVSVAGTVNLGTVAEPRNVTFYVNDRVIYDGTLHEWERLPAAEVRTVNGQTGDVVLTANDINYDSNTTVKAEIDTKADSASLATVATTGDYDDLLNKPNIPPTVIPDAAMSDTSRNPVENKVIKEYVDSWMTAAFGRELGEVWKQGTGTNTSFTMQYLVYANGLWVCGSVGYGIWWSEDGKYWRHGTGANTNYTMQYLVYANGLWVCGSVNHGIWWSEDGKSWTQGTGVLTAISTQQIVYANGLWVCGSDGRGIWWSEDGKSWTNWTYSEGSPNTSISHVKYANGLWLACVNGAYTIRWSDDGKTWYTGDKSIDVRTLVYANGLWVCGSTDAGIWWSEDGKSWTQGSGANTTYSIQQIVYANGRWVCSSVSHGCFYSSNGTYWTRATGANTNYTMQYLVYANNLWVCGSQEHGIWWSVDGTHWTQGTGANTSVTMKYLVYANGLWVCGSASNSIWLSEDGKSWTQGRGIGETWTIGPDNITGAIVYANGLWVCVSPNHGILHGRDLNDLITDGTITL